MHRYGVLIISHGSRNPEWVRLVDDAVAGVQLHGGFPVSSCYLEQVTGRLIEDGIRELEMQGVTDIVVIPLFVSAGSGHVKQIADILGVSESGTHGEMSDDVIRSGSAGERSDDVIRGGSAGERSGAGIGEAGERPAEMVEMKPLAAAATIHFGRPIDDDPALAEMIYDKIKEQSTDPKQEILLIVGHGSSYPKLEKRYRRTLQLLSDRVMKRAGFHRVETALLLPDPEELQAKMAIWNEREPDKTVIVAPMFLSEGYFTEKMIPARLGNGRFRYTGKALLPHPLISRWIEEQVARQLSSVNN